MKHITVFHKANCQPCRLTMKTLDKLGATYVARPLDDGGPEAARVLAIAKDRGLTAAPLVEVRGDDGEPERLVSGYRPSILREIVGAAQ